MAKMAQLRARGAAGSTWTIGGLIVVVVAGGLVYLNHDMGKSTPVKANTGVKAAVPAAVAAQDRRESAQAPDEEMSAELTKYTDKNGVTHFVSRDPVMSITPDGTKTPWNVELKVSNFALAQDKVKAPSGTSLRNQRQKLPRLQRDPATGKYVTGKDRNKGKGNAGTAPAATGDK